jgi:ABC-type sugar transport system ATPase subunit
MAELAGRSITKVFPDGTRALDGVSFHVPSGGVLTLLGPSGCGKSTLLRIVAGLDRPTSGAIEVDGRSIDELSPAEREVGFVFQNYALYPHLSVAGNLGLTLEARKIAKKEREQRILETAELLGISGLLSRRPGQLSGGQQQRVALGRALIRRPKLYLLDEPLSNLDALLREEMRSELKALFGRVEATVLYVTHDQAEAMSLADTVAVMRAGRILQCGPPLEIYRRPSELFVATFVGSPRMTVWPGRFENGSWTCDGLALPPPPGAASRPVLFGIRPEDVEVRDVPFAGAWEAEVVFAEPLGGRTLLTLRSGRCSARALVPPREWPSRVWMLWPPEKSHWFDRETELRL